MKCKIVQSVLFHGKHLQQGEVFDFESEHARELTEKGFVKPVKQEIKELEAVLDDESVPKVKVPTMKRDLHPSEKADIEDLAKKTKKRKAKEKADEEVVDAEIEEEAPKKTTRKKTTKKKG